VIFVDSSVWIGYFNGQRNRQTDFLDGLLGREPVAIGDIVLAEVLQGFRAERDFREARSLLMSLAIHDLLDASRALRVVENYRALRRRGITVRSTVDAIIATYCIDEGFPLLHADRDFEPFERHLGLRPALRAA
jgi:predicted nucleic acid-binding protein